MQILTSATVAKKKKKKKKSPSSVESVTGSPTAPGEPGKRHSIPDQANSVSCRVGNWKAHPETLQTPPPSIMIRYSPNIITGVELQTIKLERRLLRAISRRFVKRQKCKN
jgi:hypothetical protein